MKERLLSGWNFIRVIWLVMGSGITIQAITQRNFLMLLAGLYFVFAALANIGCFAGTCAASFDTSGRKNTITDIESKELKN